MDIRRNRYLVTNQSRVVVWILKSDEASLSATIKTVLKDEMSRVQEKMEDEKIVTQCLARL